MKYKPWLKGLSVLALVGLLVLIAQPVFAAPVGAPPLAGGGLTFEDITGFITSIMKPLAILGILLYILTLIAPVRNLIEKVGISIPQDYLLMLIFAAVLLGYATDFVDLLFG
jgi:hypothetical protein